MLKVVFPAWSTTIRLTNIIMMMVMLWTDIEHSNHYPKQSNNNSSSSRDRLTAWLSECLHSLLHCCIHQLCATNIFLQIWSFEFSNCVEFSFAIGIVRTCLTGAWSFEIHNLRSAVYLSEIFRTQIWYY